MVEVFLVGCPRSGTALLQGTLASPLNIECCPELHSFEKGFSSKKEQLD